MEKTLFIIKPEAFHRREEIKNIIICNDLAIVSTLKKRLTHDNLLMFGKLDSLYKMDRGLFNSYIHFMSMGIVELGIIEGIDAIERFRKLCGTDPNPLECAEGTLRNIFGLTEPGFFQGRKFFLNAVHKSDNRDDARMEVEIFKNL